MLYSLSLFNERQEGFFIGLFASRAKARRTAEHYLFAVPGFRDYPCTYEITEKTVIGTVDSSGTVHMISGWDEDAEGMRQMSGAAPVMRISQKPSGLWMQPSGV